MIVTQTEEGAPKGRPPPPQILPIIGIYKTDKRNPDQTWTQELGGVVARPDFLQAIVLDLVCIWEDCGYIM